MGNAEGARKARAYQIEQYGSAKKAAEILGARGGKAPHKSRSFQDPMIQKKANKLSAAVRKAKAVTRQELIRLTIQDEN